MRIKGVIELLQSKGKAFLQAAEDFRKHAGPQEEVLASVSIGLSTWLLTNERLIKLSITGGVKTAMHLANIEKARLERDKLGLDQLYVTEHGGSESKLGSLLDVAKEFLELLETARETAPQIAPSAPQGSSKNDSTTQQKADIKEEKKRKTEQKKQERREARDKKREATEARKAELEAQFGRKVLDTVLGGKLVEYYEKGFVRIGFSSTFEKVLGVEGSADSLQKKSGAGRAVGAVLTMGANVALSSNKRGDLLVTITTDKKVHTLHHTAPSAYDLKAYQEIVAVGKSLIEQNSRQEVPQSQTPASIGDELQKLVALRDSGSISDEEFARAKERLLD